MKQRNGTIDIIRITACFLIVWNHISSHMVISWSNSVSWTNIGVQVFFFMSGYLYAGNKIEKAEVWIKKNYLKILQPYWLYLIVIFPIITLLDPFRLNWLNTLLAFAGLQGFSSTLTIESLGQHWFISYILLCYLFTPWILKTIEKIQKSDGSANKHIFAKLIKVIGEGYWLYLLITMMIGQIVTVPLALLFRFKVAYVFTFIAGIFYGSRFKVGKYSEEKKKVDWTVYTIAFIGLLVRIILEIHPIHPEAIVGLFTQWIKLFQGAAIFICMVNVIPQKSGNKKWIRYLSDITYEIYLVHEFFTCEIFTGLLPTNLLGMKLVIVWLSIILAAAILKMLNKMLDKSVKTKRI